MNATDVRNQLTDFLQRGGQVFLCVARTGTKFKTIPCVGMGSKLRLSKEKLGHSMTLNTAIASTKWINEVRTSHGHCSAGRGWAMCGGLRAGS